MVLVFKGIDCFCSFYYEGGKIQATVRKPLLSKFSSQLQEGCIYKMVYFNVLPSTGGYRASSHEFRLIFLYKTTVVKKECPSISLYGLNCVPFSDVMNFADNHNYLIDVMGLLTAVYPERQYLQEGKITSMVVMELTDPSGKLECALFGEYVDILRNFLHGDGKIQVVVVVQLARVKIFKGKTVSQNSINATRLIFNPDIEEAILFRNSIAEHGSIDVEPLQVVLDNSREGFEADFMKNNPKKSVAALTTINEGGLFVVLGEIVDIVNDGLWFYLACKCNKSVSLQTGVPYCESCQIPVLHVFPRFKVKVEIANSTGTAVLILFDRDVHLLLKKNCEELMFEDTQAMSGNAMPHLIHSLIGKRMLFKVETRLEQVYQFEGTFPVRRVCFDEVIISMFDLASADSTPMKAVFAPQFPKVDTKTVDMKRPFSETDSDFLGTTISLGGNASVLPSKWCPPPNMTPAKRKLDDQFLAIKVGASVSDLKSKDVVEVDDEDGGLGCGLDAVNLEED